MRLSANWKLVLQTICLAFLAPGRRLKSSFGPSIGAAAGGGRGRSGAQRAFLLAFGHPTVEESVARKVRAAQISCIARLIPITILANLVNVIVITPVFLHLVPVSYFAIWLAAFVGFMVWTGIKWLRARRYPIEQASPRALEKVVRHATILSLLWACVPIVAFAKGEPGGIWIASCLTTGMICGGGFALSTVPQAAFRWLGVLYLASVVSLLVVGHGQADITMFFLLTSYVFVVGCSATAAAWLFASHFLAEAELEERGELIALLLNEAEDKISDWIWETDSAGAFRNVSDRFLHASGRSRSELQSMRMIDLAHSLDQADADAAVPELERVMSGREAFRDIVIGIEVNGEPRWWCLAARPVHDDRGHFAGYRGVASDVTDTRRATFLITQLAEQDSLTGIGNRSWFLNQTEDLLENGDLTETSYLTLFLIDLDNFKVVNDTSGHPAGDELLKQVAARFQTVGDDRTMLARFGGDEFAAVGCFASKEDAMAYAEELVAIARKPFRFGCRDYSIGATVGFARLDDEALTVDDLMRRADIALYKAKESGRSRALAFEAEMEREVCERRELESDLREAFENGRLSVEFQPIVDASSARVVSSEVLVRWVHPARGEVPPDVFIPIAEQAGLILPLGKWVLTRACAAAAHCPDLESIAVNLSPVQFMDPNLVGQISAVLEETGLAPKRLVLEITESIFVRDIGSASGKLKKLRDLGIGIALDDFGTGYSSLSYLRKYKFDKIKIDKCCVDEIGERSDGLAIISAVIALAHNLGIEVTAEGVERKFQAEALRTLGCDTLQGYYFGKPNPNPLEMTRSVNRAGKRVNGRDDPDESQSDPALSPAS
ncbi:EAL domain-containing protein [Rhodobacterales bacterium]|nr:EAL domain-containing protein [Rhodobacterales bacterium]